MCAMTRRSSCRRSWRNRAPAGWWPTCSKAPDWRFRFAPPTSISRSGRREIEAYQPERRDPQNYWAPTRFSYLGACYNTNLVKPGDVPKSFEDFLDPKWKGKIAWSSTVIGAMLFITGARNFMGEEKALAYLQKLAKQDIAPIASANRVVVDRVMAGEHALCLDAFLHHPIISARKGAPVAPLPLEPVLTVVSSVMLPKAPPHPYAAMLFIDYLLSKEGQARLQGADYFPAHPEVAASPDLDKIVPHKIGLQGKLHCSGER